MRNEKSHIHILKIVFGDTEENFQGKANIMNEHLKVINTIKMTIENKNMKHYKKIESKTIEKKSVRSNI